MKYCIGAGGGLMIESCIFLGAFTATDFPTHKHPTRAPVWLKEDKL